MAVRWELLQNALAQPDPGQRFWAGYEQGRQWRDQRRVRQARSTFATNPEDAEARGVLAELDPGGLASLEDSVYQRGERKRAADFRSALGDYLGGRGEPQPSAFDGPAPQPAAPGGGAVIPSQPMNALAAPPAAPRSLSMVADPTMSTAAPTAPVGGGGVQPNALMPPTPPAAVGLTAPVVPGARRQPRLFEQTDLWRRMVQADPAGAMAAKSSWMKMGKDQLDLNEEVNEEVARLLNMARDQPTYERGLSHARDLYARLGLDDSVLDNLPPEYNPEYLHELRLLNLEEKDLLAALRAERRLEWDIEDDREDNRRADREAESRAGYRRDSIKVRRERPARGAGRGAAARPPTKATVIGRVLDKQARGEALSSSEQSVLETYGGGQQFEDGDQIVERDGTVKERKGGRWVVVDE